MAKKKKAKFNDKNRLLYIIISIIVYFAILNVSIYLIDYIKTSKGDNQTVAISDKPAADKIKAKAVEAITKNPTQAKALFETAKRQYEYIFNNTPDSTTRETAQVNIIDCDAQIWLLEHK